MNTGIALCIIVLVLFGLFQSEYFVKIVAAFGFLLFCAALVLCCVAVFLCLGCV